MFRVKKALNHNTVIAIGMEDNQEYLLLGKGIGFGKKVSERIEAPEGCTIYSLQKKTERGNAMELVKEIEPVFLEIAQQVLKEGERIFGKIDFSILFPMADHIAFAVKRIQNGEQIRNPLTSDIQALFHMEYKAAECIRPILKECLEVEIDEHEIGYIALHIHSAIEDENVALSMQIARTVRECIELVEQETGITIDVMSLSYNRLMNHVRYMVARAIKGERLRLDMNDYMSIKFPEEFQMAATVCAHLEKYLKQPLDEVEIGYLAMHIQRVAVEGFFHRKESEEIATELRAMVSGYVISLTEIKDATFASKDLGDGIAIRPSKETITAPASGTISLVAETKHAIGMVLNNGAELLLHVGLDTVSLEGEGFQVFVKKGKKVKQGDPLLKFDKALIEGKGFAMDCVMTITNSDDFPKMELISGMDAIQNETVVCKF